MSQSAVSEGLINLERSSEQQLFDRKRNKLFLNSTGKSLRIEAENLLSRCQRFEDQLMAKNEIGHIKIGASYTIGNHLVARYLSEYLKHYPEAEIQLDTGNTPEVIEKLLNYDVDIGMIENDVVNKAIELIRWRSDELVVFCAKDHALAKKKSLTIKDIRQASWILREPDSGARQTFNKVMQDVLPEINVYLEFSHNEAIKNAVEAGLGIGCLSSIVIQKNLDRGELIPLKLPKRDMRRSLYFALPKDRELPAAISAWIALCQKDTDSSLR